MSCLCSRAGSGRKSPRANSAPKPVKIPTRPANRVGEAFRDAFGASTSGGEGCVPSLAGVIVNSEDTEGDTGQAAAFPLFSVGLFLSGLMDDAVIEGNMAVTIVAVAAPPILKNSLASNNCGKTFLACTKTNNAVPTIK